MTAPEEANPAADRPLDLQRVGRPETPAQLIRIYLLGGFRVVVGDDVIDDAAWRLRKAKSLVKLLALTPEHSLYREQLMERLWPDLAPEAAANNLRYALHVARRALQPATGASPRLLPAQRERLVLCPFSPVWIDAEAFESLAAEARLAADPAACDAAIDMYAGELLPEDRYEDWAAGRREALHALYLALLVDVAQLREARGEHSKAIAALERVVASEAVHEQAQVTLMRLRALSGQRSQALKQYKRFERALRQELDTEPDSMSDALYQDILAGRFPPSGTRDIGEIPMEEVSTSRANLPVSLTSFIGREREIVELQRRLAGMAGSEPRKGAAAQGAAAQGAAAQGAAALRVLTLTGAGGCGKTRLALVVAAGLAPAYPDGVWLVELAGLTDPALVPAAVAVVLGIREESGWPISAMLTGALRERRLLIVLDNCEHLVAAVAELVVVLLSACPDIQILATSRESLRVPGELTWRVPSLALPDLRRQTSAEALRGIEAVSLFLDRVHLRQPDFILTMHNAPAVVEICRRLDGLPLAIELAAARASALTIDEIAANLHDAVSFLTTGNRTDVPRQQTLRATLDWSYDLLDPREQVVLNRLAAFASGWTLEAAQEVVAGDGIVEQDVLDLLSSLTEKSLVQVEGGHQPEGHQPGGHQPGGRQQVRYRLLEPIRQYAWERLQTTGEDEQVRHLHAAFYMALAERGRRELEGAQQVEWFERLAREYDNLRTVLAWSLDRNDIGTLAQFGWALNNFWYMCGHVTEGRRWLEAPLAARSELPLPLRAKVLCAAAVMALGHEDAQAVLDLSEECLALLEEADDVLVKTVILYLLGRIAVSRHEYYRATELFEESLRLSREHHDAWGVTLALDGLGDIPLAQGDYARATQIFEECLALAREAENTTHVAESLTNLGLVAQQQGDYQQAIRLHEECLTLARELDYTRYIITALQRIGLICVLQGDTERARSLLEESLRLAQAHGSPRTVGIAQQALALALLLQGDRDRAAALLQRSLRLAREQCAEALTIDCIESLGGVAAAQGMVEHAATLLSAAATLREVAGIADTGVGQTCHARYLAAARVQIGEAAWAAAWASGREMTLAQAVESALAVVSPESTVALDGSPSNRQQEMLTAREREVAMLIARGLTNHQIAEELRMAPRTADTHVSRILRKLGLASRAQVLHWADAHGLHAETSRPDS